MGLEYIHLEKRYLIRFVVVVKECNGEVVWHYIFCAHIVFFFDS